MIFSPKIYSKPVAEMILSGEKCQTRRLCKFAKMGQDLTKKEYANYNFTKVINSVEVYKTNRNQDDNPDGTSPHRIKWQVGQDYAVQLKRGGKCLIWNPKTGEVTDDY